MSALKEKVAAGDSAGSCGRFCALLAETILNQSLKDRTNPSWLKQGHYSMGLNACLFRFTVPNKMNTGLIRGILQWPYSPVFASTTIREFRYKYSTFDYLLSQTEFWRCTFDEEKSFLTYFLQGRPSVTEACRRWFLWIGASFLQRCFGCFAGKYGVFLLLFEATTMKMPNHSSGAISEGDQSNEQGATTFFFEILDPLIQSERETDFLLARNCRSSAIYVPRAVCSVPKELSSLQGRMNTQFPVFPCSLLPPPLKKNFFFSSPLIYILLSGKEKG
ncbi:hypothetical protein VNO77_14476 [Canavalia gladiata]|uniref:Uncharacterized protein n=1 Tax=Canavalia gladiata TaxID=3824 RepID=A0AAN9QVF7_CANGL